jgi:hypothetical protein
VKANKLTVCTTIVSYYTNHGDMKLIEDGKSDDGDVGDIGEVVGKRSW